MRFTNQVQDQFKKAGWEPTRNVFTEYNDALRISEFPVFLKSFLAEYGNLIITDLQSYNSNVVNYLKIVPDYCGFEEEEDYQSYLNLLGIKLYPFALMEPDAYRVACDDDGKMYMIGDYILHFANSLKEGIEILIQDDWSKGYNQFNMQTKKWEKSQTL